MLHPLVIESNRSPTLAGLTFCPASVPSLHLFPSGLHRTPYWSRPRLDRIPVSWEHSADTAHLQYVLHNVISQNFTKSHCLPHPHHHCNHTQCQMFAHNTTNSDHHNATMQTMITSPTQCQPPLSPPHHMMATIATTPNDGNAALAPNNGDDNSYAQ